MALEIEPLSNDDLSRMQRIIERLRSAIARERKLREEAIRQVEPALLSEQKWMNAAKKQFERTEKAEADLVAEREMREEAEAEAERKDSLDYDAMTCDLLAATKLQLSSALTRERDANARLAVLVEALCRAKGALMLAGKEFGENKQITSHNDALSAAERINRAMPDIPAAATALLANQLIKGAVQVCSACQAPAQEIVDGECFGRYLSAGLSEENCPIRAKGTRDEAPSLNDNGAWGRSAVSDPALIAEQRERTTAMRRKLDET